MKNTVEIIALTILALFVGFFFGERSSIRQEKNIMTCGHSKDDVIEMYNRWINKALISEDKRAEKHPVKVIDVAGIIEYNTIPEFMNIKLYEDFKNSKVCQASLVVNYTPDSEKENNEEIEVRFQKVATSPDESGVFSTYIISAGHDIDEMTKQALEFFREYNKDKK